MSENGYERPNESFDNWKKKAALFIGGQTSSMFGSSLVQYAIIWYLTLTTQSGLVLTISTLAGFLPQILISLFAGVWADRYNRKFLIIFADVLTATSTLILAIFFLLGYQELWLIFLVSAIRSLGAGIQSPAVNALLPQIVLPDQLIRVNGINGTIQPIMMIISPLTAGALMSISRLEIIFFIDVVTAAIAVSLLLALKVPPHQKAVEGSKVSYFADLHEGLRYVWQHPVIRTLFVFYAVIFFLLTPVMFLTPLMITRIYGEEVWRLTANEITFFIGMTLGGALMTSWGGFKNHFRTIGVASVVCGLLFGGLGIVAHAFVPYLVVMFLSGIPIPMFNVPTTTLLQEMVETDVQGRVFSVMQLITTIVMPVGMLFFGPIADRVSIELLLIITGALTALPGIWLYFNRRIYHGAQPSLNPAD